MLWPHRQWVKINEDNIKIFMKFTEVQCQLYIPLTWTRHAVAERFKFRSHYSGLFKNKWQEINRLSVNNSNKGISYQNIYSKNNAYFLKIRDSSTDTPKKKVTNIFFLWEKEIVIRWDPNSQQSNLRFGTWLICETHWSNCAILLIS